MKLSTAKLFHTIYHTFDGENSPHQMKRPVYAEKDFFDERLELDLFQISEIADILPNYEDEVAQFPEYDACI